MTSDLSEVDEMPVFLPDLCAAGCVAMRICGRLRFQGSVRPFEQKRSLVTRYEMSGEPILARFVFTPRKDEAFHLHLDFGTKSWFDYREFFPELTASVEQFQSALDSVIGGQYSAVSDCYFGGRRPLLPGRVAGGGAPSGMEFELVSGKVETQGSPPLRSVEWEKEAHPAGYLYTITFDTLPTVDDSLLLGGLGYASKFFQGIIRWEDDDGA